MVERKASIANLKHQYHVFQCREHDCNVNNKNNEDYYEYPRLPHSQVNVSYTENGGKECFY